MVVVTVTVSKVVGVVGTLDWPCPAPPFPEVLMFSIVLISALDITSLSKVSIGRLFIFLFSIKINFD